jgi:CRISPR system Cascade subunit CasD
VSTLLLRLAGPMQSWGTDSRFDIRFTTREPSKSGVIGLLCAALGKPREERPDDGFPKLEQLSRLRMGVRVDRAGSLRLDYQTAGGAHRAGEHYGVIRASGARGETVQSRRYYLADADFLVGLEGDDEPLLRRLDAGLLRPVWQLSLGRKAFVPGGPVWLPDARPDGAYWPLALEEALASYPWRPRWDGEASPARLRLVMDAMDSAAAHELRYDVPIDFAERRFGPRYVVTGATATPEVKVVSVST